MSVAILDHCPSCGKCSRPGVCPTDAIKVENGKTSISEGCIDCGLCIPVCPIGVIVEIPKLAEPQPEATASQSRSRASKASVDATEQSVTEGKEATIDAAESPGTGV